VINPCHEFSVIAGVIDTGNKFVNGDNTCKHLSPVAISPAIIYLLLQWLGCLGFLWARLFMAVQIKLMAAMSDISSHRYRRFSLK
jgi:hypothetical protein